MLSIYDLKEMAVTDTPLLLFQCVLQNGQQEFWSTHQVTYNGSTYAPRVMKHNVFSVQTSSDQGVDAIPRISLSLANADSYFSEIERSVGWKGSTLTVTFLFYNLIESAATSDTAVLFQGIVNPPDQSTESLFQLSAVNWMNMQNVLLPPVRIQRRCPWLFPSNSQQRQEAVNGGSAGPYSLFYPCGYSPDQPGGAGALVGGAPYTSCAYTRTDCEARGMFFGPARYGGLEFVPSSILVRSYGSGWQYAAVGDNQAIYNDFVPLLYGTAWYCPPIVFTRNDGNLTHIEVLLGMGPIQGVQVVLVNQIEIPVGVSSQNMTATGWYNLISAGTRNGAFNPDFKDAAGNPAGDPYGSMAYLSVVVPNQISNGQSLPTIQVLADGLQLPTYGADGSYQGTEFTANPAWILLDILQRAGWSTGNIDLTSFAGAAAYCDQQIQTQDLNGNSVMIPRFQCNLCLQDRRNAADTIRGIRNTARLLFTYSMTGLLQLQVENTIALQQPSLPAGSNSTEPLSGGWPAYEFSDGSTGTANILRKTNGEPSVQISSRSIADTPNQVTVEFQDAFNGYQQDSLLTVDVDDVQLSGQVIATTLKALGIPNYDQAARVSRFVLDKSVSGNTYVTFDTSVKALGLRPGDIIAVTYLKEGFEREPFRITKIAPGANYRITTITAQIQQDEWYLDTNGQIPGGTGASLQPNSGIGLPKPLLGNIIDSYGNPEYQITESSSNTSDGGTSEEVTVGFLVPSTTIAGGPNIPLISLAATINGGGTLGGNQTLYYAVSALDSAGNESSLSFAVLASIPSGPDTNSVTLTGLSFDASTVSFNAYRGPNPQQFGLIASAQQLSPSFTDTGLPDQPWTPPDPNFDHANFYWRTELQPPLAATIATANTVGNATAEMGDANYSGMIVRILSGTGADQECSIASNTSTTITLTQSWSVQPDATSLFVVAEAAWHFAVATKTSPIQFEIPNETGTTLHIQGRGANVNNLEGPALLSTLTRWTVGGGGIGDMAPPPQPLFGLGMPPLQSGTVALSGVAFSDLTNTHSVTAGTLTLYYWDELTGTTPYSLASAMDATDTVLNLSQAGTATAGSFVQVEAEVIQVTAVVDNGLQYQVARGMHGTTPASHAAQVAAFQLSSMVTIVPFPLDFFGSPLSGNWSYPISLPNTRVASAALFVTNSRGNSPTAATNLTQSVDFGLRTLSGGQYSFQVQGFLAVDSNPAPNIVVESAHAVRDIYAIVKQAPTGGPVQLSISQNNAPYCTLTIPDGATTSASVDGFGLPLSAQAQLSLQITAVGQYSPGADMTVIVRL
ncbi:MAG TPA: phage tail protein [Bryobacteraceae bacterium]|nr:phage tail protein [Bryobacteraceae bacterium]